MIHTGHCLLTNEGYFRGILTFHYNLFTSACHVQDKFPVLRCLQGVTLPNCGIRTLNLRPWVNRFLVSLQNGQLRHCLSLDLILVLPTPWRGLGSITHGPTSRPHQFEWIVVLDADLLILKNMDELMDIPIPMMVLLSCCLNCFATALSE